jgi:hypothetical protein
MDGFVEQQTDAIACLQALIEQISRGLIGAIVEITKREGDILGHDRQMIRRHLVAALLEEVIEPFALLPTNGVIGTLANQHVTLPSGIALRRENRLR